MLAADGRTSLRTRLKLRPGQRGTKKLLAQYGDQLLCVRYRYDAQRKKRYKTVELIVDVVDWEPRPAPIAPATIVRLRVGLEETRTQHAIKSAGGVWNRVRRVWELRYDRVVELGLVDRIAEERNQPASSAIMTPAIE
jgi:hypothetical protein